MSLPVYDTQPDALTGAILAVEGITDAAVLLNGPTGCKFFHGAIAEGQLPRESSYDPLRFLDEFYFGQPRVPATYLDGHDYVFGASEKLERILPVVASKGHGLIAVINSPGAALIGDDLARFIESARLNVPCVAVESPGYSGTVEAGFRDALACVLDTLEITEQEPDPMSVNLIGLSIFHKHWEGSLAELRRLLECCGIRIHTTLSAGTTTREICSLRQATVNVMVHEEFGTNLSKYLNECLNMETLRPCTDAPIGFDRTEEWIRGICDALGADPQPAVCAIDRYRSRAAMCIKRLNSLTGLPKGASFALRARPSVALPLTELLHEYLGMIPAAVSVIGETSPPAEQLRQQLESAGFADAWNADIFSSGADMVFGSGALTARMQALDSHAQGVEIALPSIGEIYVVPRALLGAEGALYLIESILNGLNEC